MHICHNLVARLRGLKCRSLRYVHLLIVRIYDNNIVAWLCGLGLLVVRIERYVHLLVVRISDSLVDGLRMDADRSTKNEQQ